MNPEACIHEFMQKIPPEALNTVKCEMIRKKQAYHEQYPFLATKLVLRATRKGNCYNEFRNAVIHGDSSKCCLIANEKLIQSMGRVWFVAMRLFGFPFLRCESQLRNIGTCRGPYASSSSAQVCVNIHHFRYADVPDRNLPPVLVNRASEHTDLDNEALSTRLQDVSQQFLQQHPAPSISLPEHIRMGRIPTVVVAGDELTNMFDSLDNPYGSTSPMSDTSSVDSSASTPRDVAYYPSGMSSPSSVILQNFPTTSDTEMQDLTEAGSTSDLPSPPPMILSVKEYQRQMHDQYQRCQAMQHTWMEPQRRQYEQYYSPPSQFPQQQENNGNMMQHCAVQNNNMHITQPPQQQAAPLTSHVPPIYAQAYASTFAAMATKDKTNGGMVQRQLSDGTVQMVQRSEADSPEYNGGIGKIDMNVDRGIYELVEYEETKQWLTVTYHEYNLPLMEPFDVVKSHFLIDGFTSSSIHKDRLSLGYITNHERTGKSTDIRKRIGRGIRFYYLGGEVFVESLCEWPVFVQSVSANIKLGFPLQTISKVMPYSTMKVFNNAQFAVHLSDAADKTYQDVYALGRMCTVYVSFGQGWGDMYKQRTLQQTPCWIEAKLNGPLRWIDKVLSCMGVPPTICSSFT